jgi:hypothetical protein
MPKETVIAENSFLDLEATIGGGEDGDETFRITKNLVEVSLLSNFAEKRDLIEPALTGFWGTPIEVLTMTTEEEIFAYIRLNGIEDATFFVGAYPNLRPPVEAPPTARELNALKLFAGMKRGSKKPAIHPV